MLNKFKVLLVLLFSIFVSACVTKPAELNRAVFDTNKVSKVAVSELEQSISPELSDAGTNSGVVAGGLLGALVGGAIDAGVNSSRKKKFAQVVDGLSEYDVNAAIKANLVQKLVGASFVDTVIVVSADEVKAKNAPSNLPRVLPSVLMSPTYGVVTVQLSLTMNQLKEEDKKYLGYYTSQQFVEDDGLEVDKDKNRQFWIDNPASLISKINAGIESVTQQFADDFNGKESAQSLSDDISIPSKADVPIVPEPSVNADSTSTDS